MSKETLAFLPRPTLTSGKCTSYEVAPEGEIDWSMVRDLWVQSMSLERDGHVSRVYAPCVVFLDGTWLPIGPMGELDAARHLCHRWSAIHDASVSDMTRPRPPAISPEGNLIDISPADLGGDITDDAWSYDAKENRFRLNLACVGTDLAIKVMNHGRMLDQKIEALTPGLDRIEAIFRACKFIQPHYVRPWMEKVREAAVWWLRETDWSDADYIKTPEDDGRSLADEVRKEGVTLDVALVRLKDRIVHLYKEMRWDDGTLVEDRAERGEKAFMAGAKRLAYFAGDK
ncbi:hypothetical protein B0W47_17735 (plasmid) [Komagataeibacter nataicola]|uniref:Uncharacterized protein n=4 Tax=Komagataeibacter nataicola TaxID=265960 RepID=A0A9N7CE79_9PROT|nr:hypothetical protein [Komagataeibacter nataicola]AQU89392.1 hypothetical protein B0W47_17735 [Komagataeibacter nataicola]WNM10253.1 hypothetical protein RI056_18290 [Komagataeibacter nataicola]WNM10269.1 hypothetical protein RI056_18380 [Komagataeibacter nataicola]GBR20923.1 hypothetical protein AA0616_1909 [Komagataeibacter nataicola NRIC 0616]